MGEFSEIDEFMEKDDLRINFLFEQVIPVGKFCDYYRICSQNQNTFFSELYSRFRSISLLPNKSSDHVTNMGKNRYGDICTCDKYRVYLWDDEVVRDNTKKIEKAFMDEYKMNVHVDEAPETFGSNESVIFSDTGIKRKSVKQQNITKDQSGTLCLTPEITSKLRTSTSTVPACALNKEFVDLKEARLAGFHGYINATYIGGAFDDREYIATQGPLINTINDFYHMLWQEECKCIVMLCGFVEIMREKCAEYLPTFKKPITCSFRNIVVELMKTKDVTECLTISILKLTSDSDVRYITHYHYTGWPDRGVPLGESSFNTLVLLQQLLMWTQDDDYSKPTIVHCSAGVGRTGTFLVFDMNVKRLLDGTKTVTICPYISRMRKVRPAMVQTEEQFIFAHQLLVHHVNTNYLELDYCMFYTHLLTALSDQEGPIYKAYWEPFQMSEAMEKDDENTEVPKDLDIILYLNKLYFPDNIGKLFEIDSFIDDKSFFTTCNPDKDKMEEFIDSLIEKEIKVVLYIGEDSESLRYYYDHIIVGKYSIQVQSVENINGSFFREININNNDKIYTLMHCQFSLFDQLTQNGISFDRVILQLSSFILYSYKFWVLNSSQKGPSFVIHSSNPEVKNASVLLCLLIMQNIELNGGKVDIPKALNRLRIYLPRCLPKLNDYLIALKALACVLNPK